MTHILISSSVLILAIVLARLILGKKISHTLRYALWLLVAIRLLIPFDYISTDFSINNFTREPIEKPITQVIRQPISGPSYEAVYADVRQELQALSPDIEPVQLEQMAASETRQRITVPTVGEILEIIWIAGICITALWFLVTNLNFFRKAAKGSRPVETAGVPLPVRISDQIHSPCLLGFFRPVIYITPACTQTDEHLHNVCAHEQTHWKHGDNWWALVRCVCLCIYWFHPLVWLAAILSRRDCELACDEGALKTLGDEHRLSYGKTLLDIVSANSRPANLLHTATSMHASKKQLKERIRFIVSKPKRYIAAILVLTLVIGLTVGCTFTGASNTPSTDPATHPTAPTTVPETQPQLSTTPATEPQVTNPVSYFSLSMGEDYEHVFSITVYPNGDGSVHVEYVGQERKVADMDASVLDSITLALKDSGLEAYHLQDEMESGEANASMYIDFADGTFLAVGYSGVIPEGFAQGYDKMDAFFQALMQDVPVYVPVPTVLGEVDPKMQDVIMGILTSSHVDSLDFFYITQPPRDEHFLSSVGLSSEKGIQTAVLCGDILMNNPFSIVVVTVGEGADQDAVCADFQANLNWTKWICVAPSDALIATKDNMVLCLLAPQTLYSQIEAAIFANGWTAYATQPNPNFQ